MPRWQLHTSTAKGTEEASNAISNTIIAHGPPQLAASFIHSFSFATTSHLYSPSGSKPLLIGGRDVGQILIGEGLAHPYICGATNCPASAAVVRWALLILVRDLKDL